MKASIIYARVSSKEQEESGYSLDAQEKFLLDYGEKREFNIVKIFRIAESASKWQVRKTLNEMLEYADANGVNIILCEKIDRLTRSLKDAAIVDDWVHGDREREVHFAKENFVLNINTRAHENLVWDMKVAIARFYTNNLSEEVKKGQKEKLAQGWLPTKPPLGYRTIGEKGRKVHVIDDEKAAHIRRAFELYASGNFSLNALRDELFSSGLRTRAGSKLSKGRLAEILRDPFYVGSMRWKDVLYEKALHEPLVSRELFDKVQYLLTHKGAPHYKRHAFTFTRMMVCGECGGTISGEIQKGRVYYSCKHSKLCSQRGTNREDAIEKKLLSVFQLFESITTQEAEGLYAKIRADHQVEIDYKENALKSMQQRYNALQRQLDILYDDRLGEKISQDRWQSKQSTINDEQKQILSDMQRIKNQETKYFEFCISIIDLARRARDIYEKRTPEQRRLLLQHMFSNITLKDREITYELRKPLQILSNRVQNRLDSDKKFELQENPVNTGFSGGSHPPNDSLLRG